MDIWVLPWVSLFHPTLSEKAFNYRYLTSNAAEKRSVSESLAGARFPWESARTGRLFAPALLFFFLFYSATLNNCASLFTYGQPMRDTDWNRSSFIRDFNLTNYFDIEESKSWYFLFLCGVFYQPNSFISSQTKATRTAYCPRTRL